ncbi:M28 family metallopeptidase [Blastopirellula marina]|uniref:Peptidase M28 n=1 Tax=Blastopirellula marina TaxID=124 RepID=A0A2S8F532_9BACT|nr:M28 family metallopeptidase [Blastopirellula marina]PQO27261.1 peptidase M28 [Blastopirellula marina]PTL41407.1 peptidase M28 [Blastopirellula marina]
MHELLDLEERLFLHVDRLAGLIGPRTLKRPTSIDAAISYIRGQWQASGYNVDNETYDALGDTATNLIAEIPGSRRPQEIVLLGAHYDTVPETPGADDNASAVAVLLEVARLLKDHIGKRTVRYVAFACEEPPYYHVDAMGSQHHAREAKRRGDKIVGMLCLEMVGYFRDEPGTQVVPKTIPKWLHGLFPKRGNFLTAVGNLRSWQLVYHFRRGFKRGSKMPLFSIALPEAIREIRMSDNSSFWDQGYPALMLTDTSFLRNPHYHEPTDTPNTLNYGTMAQVTLGVASAMKRLLK